MINGWKNLFAQGLTSLLIIGCSSHSGHVQDINNNQTTYTTSQKEPHYQPTKKEDSPYFLTVENLSSRIKKKHNIEVLIDEKYTKGFEGGYFYGTPRPLKILKSLEKDLGIIYPPLLSQTKRIIFEDIRDRAFFMTGMVTKARVPHNEPDTIIFDPEWYNLQILAHEAAHTHEIQLNENFHKNWISIMDNPKTELPWGFIKNPDQGFINGLGQRGPCVNKQHNGEPRWHEDIATFVAEVYAPNYGNFRHTNQNDKRYEEKLKVLREHELISEEQFNGAISSLGKDFKPSTLQN